jgi:adenosylcobyric acid synthase
VCSSDLEQTTREVRAVGPLAVEAGEGPASGASLGEVAGYEIHMGESRLLPAADTDGAGERRGVRRPFPEAEGGAATDRVLGTYLHGIFENRTVREAFVASTYAAAGRERPAGDGEHLSPFDGAAALVARAGRDRLAAALSLPELAGGDDSRRSDDA